MKGEKNIYFRHYETLQGNLILKFQEAGKLHNNSQLPTTSSLSRAFHRINRLRILNGPISAGVSGLPISNVQESRLMRSWNDPFKEAVRQSESFMIGGQVCFYAICLVNLF